jgi:hypothetical protein
MTPRTSASSGAGERGEEGFHVAQNVIGIRVRTRRRDERRDERALGRPAAVDGRLRDARALRHRVDGQLAIAAFGQHLPCDVEDLLVRAFPPRTAAAALRC